MFPRDAVPPLGLPGSWLSQAEAHVPSGSEWLSEKETGWLAGMRFPKRRNEFRLGRWTAKRAIAIGLGLPEHPAALADIEIARAPDGAPLPLLGGRPAPLALSMTDRAGWAVCLIAQPQLAVGCDLELIETRSSAFVADYLTEPEQRLVRSAGDDAERARVANLVWCGKESALKVLRTGLRRDTRSVEVSFPIEGSKDGWAPLLVTAQEGPRFPGWWRRFGAFLLTVAADRAWPPPVALEEATVLDRAVPAESWLGRPNSPRTP